MVVVPIPLPAGFRCPRSYVGSITIDVADQFGVTFDGSSFTFRDSINVDWVLRTRLNVWDWSSNVYTPDWIIDAPASSAEIAGSPVIDGFYAEVRVDLNRHLRYIWIQPGGLPGNLWTFDLPPAPPGYWLPGS